MLKGLAYRSVAIPGLPPRPLLALLTGGYRRGPVLQIGADIWCDNHIILPALGRLFPSPTFYPAGCEGIARGLCFAWDRALWMPTIGVLTHFIGEHIPADFIKDPKEGQLGIDISKEAMAPEMPLYRQRVTAQYAWLKTALADGRKFVFGDATSALVLTCHQTLCLLRKNCLPEVDEMLGIGALGRGPPNVMSPEEAFAPASDAQPVRLRVQGTHTGAFGDMAATGCKIDIGVLDLFQIMGGMLIEHWALLDNLGLLKQLGAIPA